MYKHYNKQKVRSRIVLKRVTWTYLLSVEEQVLLICILFDFMWGKLFLEDVAFLNKVVWEDKVETDGEDCSFLARYIWR